MEKQFNNGGGSHVLVDIAALQEFSELLQSQPNKLYSDSWRRRRRQIQKVSPQIRRRKRRNEQVYDPVMVSIGPYHHGKPALRQAEELKHLCLDRCAGGDEKKKAFFYSKILEEIDVVRDSYSEAKIIDKYDDKSLALMMLLDASIIIDFIRNFLDKKEKAFLDWRRCLGAGSALLMIRDMFVMENQIPFQILKLLINLQNEEKEEEEEEEALFISRFFTEFLSHDMEMEVMHAEILNPNESDDPALHILEALWRVMVKKHKKHYMMSEPDNINLLLSGFPMRKDKNISYTHRSVMDLKAKGIRLRPYSTRSPWGMTFAPSFCFSHLHLPVLYISDLTPVILSNMIAFEVSPNGTNCLVLLSYTIFLKSLIQGPEDVKELQDNGIMRNRLANLEKVVEMIKEIDTFGLHDQDGFKDVKRRIEEHCSSRARTWFAELIYTRFRNPWTAMAFFAAMLLLYLTFLQTFFTIRRVSFGVAVVLMGGATSMSRSQPFGEGWVDGECYLVKDGVYIGSALLGLVALGSNLGSSAITIMRSKQAEQDTKVHAAQVDE